MEFFIQALEDYRRYLPCPERPDDFDTFWQESFALSGMRPLELEKTPAPSPSPQVDTYHIAFKGCDGSRITGILLTPIQSEGKFPVLCHYHGFGGNCGQFSDFVGWAELGYAVISIDIRGQGGKSENKFQYSSGKNLIQYGILDPHEYYLRWVALDCIRAIDAILTLLCADPRQVIVHGGSQGGGLAVMMAGLDKRVTHCLCDVPSSSDIVGRIEGRHGMFSALTDFIDAHPDERSTVYHTVSYFDTINLASRITADVLASAGMQDQICPAKMFCATYNRITSPKCIYLYKNAGHEGGAAEHHWVKTQYLKKLIQKV